MIKQYVLSFTMLFFSVITIAQKTLNPKFEKQIEDLIDHSIPTITCDGLKQKLGTSTLHILDAREKVEYQVSHLPNATYVGYDHFDKTALKNISKESTIVIYCSVGYRSEKIGEQLKQMGYKQVYNLYGGIFEWTNRSYPLVNNKNQSTTSIHAYNKEWGAWLSKGTKVY